MRRKLLFGIVIVLLATAGQALAYPSLLGPTGGANLPTAVVAPEGTLSLAVDYFDQTSPSIDAAVPIRLLYSATPKFEIGGTFTEQSTDAPDDLNSWGINGKYAAPFPSTRASWGVGVVHSEFTDHDEADFTQVYGVLTAMLTQGPRNQPAIRGTAGLNWTTFSNDADAVRPYLAADIIFPSKAVLNFELQFRDDDVENHSLSSVVLRYPFTPELSGEIGVSNAFRGVIGTDDHDFLVGINYTWRPR